MVVNVAPCGSDISLSNNKVSYVVYPIILNVIVTLPRPTHVLFGLQTESLRLF